VIEARIGANGAKDGIRRDGGEGKLKDIVEHGAEVLAAAFEEAGGAGVTVNGACVVQAELLGNVKDVAPFQEILFDGLAVGVAADGTLALVAGKGLGRFLLAQFRAHFALPFN
jgi:hypothetical protein